LLSSKRTISFHIDWHPGQNEWDDHPNSVGKALEQLIDGHSKMFNQLVV
jgi:hypothetical protein